MDVGQRPQQNRIHNGKDRRICADAERQRYHHDEREGRVFRQCSYAEANVLRELLQQCPGTDVTDALSDLVDSSHFATGMAICLAGRHP